MSEDAHTKTMRKRSLIYRSGLMRVFGEKGGDAMDFKDMKKRRYHTYLEDVEIARQEIAEMKLFPEENIICDLYALPSHNFQTYYAMIYEHAGHLEMVYARTELYGACYEEPVRMYSFRTTKINFGLIITGIKHIPAETGSLLADIAENLPDGQHILKEERVVICDGVFQAVRVFDGNCVIKEVVYENAEWVSLKDRKEYLKEELSSLYIKIGDLIRN